jgi:hypothetical protein
MPDSKIKIKLLELFLLFLHSNLLLLDLFLINLKSPLKSISKAKSHSQYHFVIALKSQSIKKHEFQKELFCTKYFNSLDNQYFNGN